MFIHILLQIWVSVFVIANMGQYGPIWKYVVPVIPAILVGVSKSVALSGRTQWGSASVQSGTQPDWEAQCSPRGNYKGWGGVLTLKPGPLQDPRDSNLDG